MKTDYSDVPLDYTGSELAPATCAAGTLSRLANFELEIGHGSLLGGWGFKCVAKCLLRCVQ